MEERSYRNKAFLSYRHTEKDERLAARLQRELESYRIPRGIREKVEVRDGKLPSRGVGRIFRDTTDLGARADLTGELRRELEDSEYLIVLCSENAVGSQWIGREIRYFLQTHGAESILPVIADGEPEEILPAMFAGIEGMSRHPIACDFRDASGHRHVNRRRSRREEVPRLAAALLGCSYDELVNRRQRYEIRRMAAVMTGAVLLLSAVTAYYAFGSLRIRRSYRERQIGESESLAIQSETALNGNLRLDAIRYALDALPEKEGDRPVAGRAVLALQKAAAAYVPEGDRTTAQTAEFQAPGRIIDFKTHKNGETVYVSALYGANDLILWNADTNEVLYDSAGEERERGIGEQAPGDSSQFLAEDLLLYADTSSLTGIELSTGKRLWRAEEEEGINLRILDVRGGRAVLVAWGVRRGRIPSAQAAEMGDGAQIGEMVIELQIRSTADGSLLYTRKTPQQLSAVSSAYLEEASFTGNEGKVVFQEYSVNPESDGSGSEWHGLYIWDPGTGEERILTGRGYICDHCVTKGGQVVTVSCAGINRPAGEGYNSDDEAEIWYTQKEEEALTVCKEDPESGEVLWKTKSSSTQHYNTAVDVDLTAAGQAVCLLSTGTHMDLFSQDTGEVLHSFDLPGLPVSWRTGMINGEEALLTILQDGAQAAYFFSSGEILKKDGVFPSGIVSAQKTAEQSFLLCGEEGIMASNDRIYAFGEDVFDPDAVYIRNSGGDLLKTDGSMIGVSSSDSTGSLYGNFIAAEDLFLLLNKNKESYVVSGVDARTGEIRWETGLGDHADFAGFANNCGILVFRDHILDGREAALRASRGEPAPEETWKLVHIEDGHTETVTGIAGSAFEDKTGTTEICRCAAGADSLVLSVIHGEAKEVWLLRYSLRDGKTEKIRLPDETDETIRFVGFPNQIAISPDGRIAACGFSYRDYTEDGKEKNDWINLFIDWKTRKITEAAGTPPVDGAGCIVWNEDSTEAAFVGYNNLTALSSPTGRLLYRSSGQPAEEAGRTQEQAREESQAGTRPEAEQEADRAERTQEQVQVESLTGRIQGIGFWNHTLFLIEEVGFDIHFRVPQQGIDILLPAGRQARLEQSSYLHEMKYSAWELSGGRILLQYGTQSYVIDPESGITEAVIDHMKDYNPQTDTILLSDRNEHLAVVPRYDWESLAEKARKILRE